MIIMLDFTTILGSLVGISTVIGIVYKAGRWSGKIDKSLQELTEQQKQVNVNLSNHIVHYDMELTAIRIELAKLNK